VLAFRQALRNLERCVGPHRVVRSGARATFERFLEHDDPRVRARAAELARFDAEERALSHALRESEAIAEERSMSELQIARTEPARDGSTAPEHEAAETERCDEEIPY
jgi:hypothetical protein